MQKERLSALRVNVLFLQKIGYRTWLNLRSKRDNL